MIKSAILIGTMITSALAEPIAERHLAASGFKGPSGNIDYASITGTKCEFMTTADIFSHKWNAGFDDTNATKIEQTFTAPTDGEPVTGSYNYIGSANVDQWNSTDAIHLGTFRIDFVLNNKIDADSNYKFYKFVGTGSGGSWSEDATYSAVDATNTLLKEEKQEIVTVCFYKNAPGSACNGATYQQEVTVDLPTTGQTTTQNTDPVKISLRKVLGVASKCGGADSTSDVGETPRDIFAWAKMEATNTLDFTISVQNTDSIVTVAQGGNNLDGEHDLLPGDDGHTSGQLAYSLTMTSSHEVHDLLFLDGDVSSPTLKSTGGSFTDASGDVSINYNVGYSIAGEVSRNAASGSGSCSSTLTVDAMGTYNSGLATEPVQGYSVWHCFRAGHETAPMLFPGSGGGDGIHATNQTGGAEPILDVLNTRDHFNLHGACSARLRVECSFDSFNMTGADSRSCNADVNGGVTTDEADGVVGEALSEADCLLSTWWLKRYEYVSYNPVTILKEAAIIQAVRLRQTRQYPQNASDHHTESQLNNYGVKHYFGTTVDGVKVLEKQDTDWLCDDDECNNDPYKILVVKESSEFLHCNTSGALVGTSSGVVTQPEWTQACYKTGSAIDISASIQTPPAKYPETYVFAAVSFNNAHVEQTTPKINEVAATYDSASITIPNQYRTVGPDNINENINTFDTPTDAQLPARRLLSDKSIESGVTYFQVTDAIQHGLSF